MPENKEKKRSLGEGVIISGKDISLSYDGKTVASGLNFEVMKGDYLCIVGDNGSGKSTLLRCLLGLKNISGGSLEMSEEAKKEGFGYLPQATPGEKDFPATVREIVMSGRICRGGFKLFYTKADKAAAKAAMERLGILDISEKTFSRLSGGQQQRTLLARAMCACGSLIFLDEPVTGLDEAATREMYDIILDMNRNQGITVVMVSHDIERSLQYATKIFHIGGAAGDNYFVTRDEFFSMRHPDAQ